MKKIDHKTPHRKQDLSSLPFYDINTTISATECTGIAPAGIHCPHEAEAISELYDIHTPRPSHQLQKTEQTCRNAHCAIDDDLDISPDE